MLNKVLKDTKNLELFSKRGETAIEASLTGGEKIISTKTSRKATSKGGEYNYVTSGDTASERAIVSLINKRFPNDAIVAEETYTTLAHAEDYEHVWAIDPIDGTFNYSKGIHYCGVSVGGVEQGIVKRGAIYNPFTKELFCSEQGRGAYKNGKKIHVGSQTDLPTALVDTDAPSSRPLRQINLTILAKLNPYAHIRGSLVANVARVAAAESDLYFCASFGGPWDIAAGISLIQEAGGVVFDLDGNDLTNKRGSFLATTIVVGNRKLVQKFARFIKPIITKAKNENPRLFAK